MVNIPPIVLGVAALSYDPSPDSESFLPSVELAPQLQIFQQFYERQTNKSNKRTS